MSIHPTPACGSLTGTGLAILLSLSFLGGCDQSDRPESPSGAEGPTRVDAGPVLSEVVGDGRLAVGKQLLVSGRLDESLVIFETVVRERPELARAHFLKGLALHGKKSHAQALAQYQRAESLLQSFPERALLDYYVAWSAFYAGDSELSRERVERCLKEAPDQADLNFLAGLLAFNDDRLQEAEDSFRRALRSAEREPEPARSKELRRAWIRLSDVLARDGRQEEALEAIVNAIEIGPDFAESWFRRGSLLSRLGRVEEAEEALARWRALGGGSDS